MLDLRDLILSSRLLVFLLVIMILNYLFISPKGRTLLLLYVDDMMITSDDLEHISHVKKHLSKEFHMSGLGPLTYFLGIEVQHTPKGFYRAQSKYI
jgi:hypothetical protein